jgi:hypothetical protein
VCQKRTYSPQLLEESPLCKELCLFLLLGKPARQHAPLALDASSLRTYLLKRREAAQLA